MTTLLWVTGRCIAMERLYDFRHHFGGFFWGSGPVGGRCRGDKAPTDGVKYRPAPCPVKMYTRTIFTTTCISLPSPDGHHPSGPVCNRIGHCYLACWRPADGSCHLVSGPGQGLPSAPDVGGEEGLLLLPAPLLLGGPDLPPGRRLLGALPHVPHPGD